MSRLRGLLGPVWQNYPVHQVTFDRAALWSFRRHPPLFYEEAWARVVRGPFAPAYRVADILDRPCGDGLAALIEGLSGVPERTAYHRASLRTTWCARLTGWPAAAVALALARLAALGVPLPLDRIVGPFAKELRRKRWLAPEDMDLSVFVRWTPRQPCAFVWPARTPAPELPPDGTMRVCALADGRTLFVFARPDGAPVEVVAREPFRHVAPFLLWCGCADSRLDAERPDLSRLAREAEPVDAIVDVHGRLREEATP